MKTVINIKQLIGKLEIINLPCADGTHSDVCREHLEKQLSQTAESCLSAVLATAHNAAEIHNKDFPENLNTEYLSEKIRAILNEAMSNSKSVQIES